MKINTKFLSKYKFYLVFFIIVCLIIRIIFSVYTFNYKYEESIKDTNIYVTILNKEKVSEKYISYVVSLNNSKIIKDKFLLYIYKDKKIYNEVNDNDFFLKHNNYKYGDILKLKGKVAYPKKLGNLHEFDYKLYLNSKNIIATINTYSVEKISESNFNFLKLINIFKDKIENKINISMPEKEANLFKSMIYGNDIDLDKDIKDNFTDLGIAHIIAVSGSNVSIVLLLLRYILKKLKIKNSNIISCILIYIFCSLCNFEISVIRASIMICIALIFPIKINKYILLIITFLIIFFINPCVIFSVSFILSFTATFGIILFNKRINSFFNLILFKIFKLKNILKFRKNKKSKLRFLYNVCLRIFNIMSIYFSVQLILFPLQIYFFGSFNLLSLFSNIIIHIFSSLQLIIGIIFIILCFIPFIFEVISYLNFINLSFIIQITETLNNIRFFNINFIKPDIICIICYYIFICCLIFKHQILILLKYKLNKNINKNIFNWILLFCLAYIIIFNVYTKYFLNFVYYFNVEQGNMSVIKQGEIVILIDMGTTGSLKLGNILTDFLKAYNIDKVDYFIITHFHKDHISGIFELEEKFIKNSFKINAVIYSYDKFIDNNEIKSSFSEKDINFKTFRKYINDNNIKEMMVEKFDKYELNKNIIIDILNPPNDKIINSKDKVNSNSLVTNVSISKNNFLFMGDATLESEIELINNLKDNKYYINKLNDISCIQIGHHGSNTSSSEYFLKNLTIKEAVISSKKSVYNHPSNVILNRLKSNNITTYITEKDGGIMNVIM